MQIKIKGIHCQESPTIIINLADHASADQIHSDKPRKAKSGSNGPLVTSANIRIAYPTPKGVIISGMKKTTRKKFLPEIGCEHKKANPVPITN